jgi:Cof subfamily protein (haloacid dehalogenase superfamily)
LSAGSRIPKLVALDVDGTLVGRDLSISPKVREAVARMREAGIAVCLVTGRMYRSTVPFARELHLDTPLICYQGAAIIDPTTDDVLDHVALSNSIVRELITVAESDRIHLQLFRNDEYYCEARNRFSELYAALSMTEPVIVTSLREAFAYSPATKAVIVADAPVAQDYAGRLAQRFGGRAYVTRSLPEFDEVLDPSVDKGAALRFVAARLGVPMEQTLAIGDSWNDAPLLQAAGFAVAMGSAPEELRAIADACVGDVAHDGAAEAIEKYVLATPTDVRS